MNALLFVRDGIQAVGTSYCTASNPEASRHLAAPFPYRPMSVPVLETKWIDVPTSLNVSWLEESGAFHEAPFDITWMVKAASLEPSLYDGSCCVGYQVVKTAINFFATSLLLVYSFSHAVL